MRLDFEFVIYACVIIACLLPLYIYRRKIFSFNFEPRDINIFIKEIKEFLSKEYPKIDFDYSIFEKTKNEKDLKLRETIIVEDLVNQFFYFPFIKQSQNSVSRDKYWPAYEEKSKSNPKYPNDWALRKKFAWARDNEKCNRCATKIKQDDANVTFAREIRDGGGYNFENIIILCPDCNKVLNSQNPKNTISSLILNDKLMIFVKP